MSNNDIIEGKDTTSSGAVIEAGGFDWAFPDQADAKYLTDCVLGAKVHSVLQDYGLASLRIRYEFDPRPVKEILSIGGNSDLGQERRVFQDVDVEVKYQNDRFEIVHEATTGPLLRKQRWSLGSLADQDLRRHRRLAAGRSPDKRREAHPLEPG
ncbi:MAG: hypothetical protein ACPL7K_04725 [Armatimonadota bacterium]